jgi:hypothetical protein
LTLEGMEREHAIIYLSKSLCRLGFSEPSARKFSLPEVGFTFFT